MFWQSSTWTYKNKLYKTSDCWSRNLLNIEVSKKCLGPVSSLDFAHDFSRKIFLLLCFISWSDFIVWLPLLLLILGNISIVIIFVLVCEIIRVEINLFGPLKTRGFLIVSRGYRKRSVGWNGLSISHYIKAMRKCQILQF